jgi:outer membrane lipoprotein-sorting protein
MRGRLADLTWRPAARALSVGIVAATAAGLAAAPAQAGSSTHAKTVPGAKQTAPKQASAPAAEETAPEPAAEPAEKTAKAEPAGEATESLPEDAPQEAAISPIGGAWETETLVRPEAADEEITDAEALAIIDNVNAYFNDLTEVRAQFVQYDANNEKKSGDFYFQRPGKVRFDYDRPSRMKIISDGEYLAVENHDLRTSDRYPLDATPFKLLLAEEVNLLRDARILAIDKGEDVLILTMEDKSGESAGKIRLFFRTDPELTLASWIITDAQGVDTRVDIGEMQRDVQLAAELFEFSDIGLPDFRGR